MTAFGWALRLITAAALAADAYVHADLAGLYDRNGHGLLTQGNLFRAEAAVAALTALLLVVAATRLVWAFALVVAASALGTILLYRYLDVGALGPLPDMYEPNWYPEKTLAARAETVGAAAALVGLLAAPRRRRPAAERRTNQATHS